MMYLYPDANDSISSKPPSTQPEAEISRVLTTEDEDKHAIEDGVLANERVCSMQSPLEVRGQTQSR